MDNGIYYLGTCIFLFLLNALDSPVPQKPAQLSLNIIINRAKVGNKTN